MAWAILDTGIYIGRERGLYEDVLEAVRRGFIVRHSAVVLSELRRGARSEAARRLIEGLYRLAGIQWEPTAADWWEAGRLILKIGDAEVGRLIFQPGWRWSECIRPARASSLRFLETVFSGSRSCSANPLTCISRCRRTVASINNRRRLARAISAASRCLSWAVLVDVTIRSGQSMAIASSLCHNPSELFSDS